jgi:hypothetical protein
MTKVKESIYVVGGDNDRIKLDDNYVYLLNSAMINYPPIPDSVVPEIPVRYSHYPDPIPVSCRTKNTIDFYSIPFTCLDISIKAHVCCS